MPSLHLGVISKLQWLQLLQWDEIDVTSRQSELGIKVIICVLSTFK